MRNPVVLARPVDCPRCDGLGGKFWRVKKGLRPVQNVVVLEKFCKR